MHGVWFTLSRDATTNFIIPLADGPGVCREKKFEKKILKKKFGILLAYNTATHECPQKNVAQSIQPFG